METKVAIHTQELTRLFKRGKRAEKRIDELLEVVGLKDKPHARQIGRI